MRTALLAAAVCGVMALHVWQSLRCFPDSRAILDRRPIIQVDHALHLYHGSLGSQFLRDHGANWGYDPAFMAGYPKTPFHDPSAGLADLSMLLAGGGYDPAAYKIGLLVTMATFPLLMLIAARMLGVRLVPATIGVLLSLWFYWTGFPKTLLDSGLYSFLWSSAWLAAACGAAVYWHDKPGPLSWLALVAVASFTPFVHPTAGPMLVLPMGIFYAYCLGKHSLRWHAGLWAAVALSVAANRFWLSAFWQLAPLRRPGYVFMATAPDDWLFILNYYSANPLPLGLLLFGIAGLWLWRVQGRSDAAIAFGGLIFVMFALTFWGSCFQPTRALEPLRFQAPLHLLLAIPAGETLVTLLRGRVRKAPSPETASADANESSQTNPEVVPKATPFLHVAVRGAGVVVLCLIGAVFWQLGIFGHTALSLQHVRPFAVGLKPPMVDLCRWIRDNTHPKNRVMIEDQLRLLEPTTAESLHWTCLLPIFTEGREYIGGQYQQVPLLHRAASLGDFHLGGEPIENYDAERLRDYFLRYNVGTVLCWSERTREAMDRLPFLRQVAVLPRYTGRPAENRYFAYRVELPVSPVAQGRARVVSAVPNRIELEDVEPEDGLVVLRYHWLESFATDPPTPLERVAIGDDPIGFIGIRTDRRLSRLTIYNSYRKVRHRPLETK